MIDDFEQFGYLKHPAPGVVVVCDGDDVCGGEPAQGPSHGIGGAARGAAEVFEVGGGHRRHGFYHRSGGRVGAQCHGCPFGMHCGDGLGHNLGVVAGDFGGVCDVSGGRLRAGGTHRAVRFADIDLVWAQRPVVGRLVLSDGG